MWPTHQADGPRGQHGAFSKRPAYLSSTTVWGLALANSANSQLLPSSNSDPFGTRHPKLARATVLHWRSDLFVGLRIHVSVCEGKC